MKVANKLITAIIFSGVALSAPLSATASDKPIYVKSLTGQVSVTVDGNTYRVSSGAVLPWGAVIEAKENSYAVLSTPDGSTLTIYPETHVRLEPSLIETRPRVIVSFGTVFHRVAKFFSRMVSFKTYTSSIACGVRGTAYFVEAGLDGSSFIYVTEGKVEVNGRVLQKGEALEKTWTEKGWKKRILKVKKYAPGRWFRKHRKAPRFLLKALFPNGIPEGEPHEKALKIALKKGELEAGDAFKLRKVESRVSLFLARTDLLTHPRVREYLPEASLKKVHALRANLKRANTVLRKLPRRIRHGVERELRLMNISKETLEKFLSLPPEKRRELIEKLRKWKKLTSRERSIIIRNYIRFQRLSPEKRREIIANYRRFKKMSPAERKKVLELYKKWKSLPPEKREKIRRRMRKTSGERQIKQRTKTIHEIKRREMHLRRNRR